MRNPACCSKETKRGAWSKQEDQKLASYDRAHGEGCWNSLPKPAGLCHCGKSCWLRWTNYSKRGNFAEDEEDLIIKLHALLGNRWLLIAGRLPGRTGNEVKNYWNSYLKRKLIAMGIDPNNHRIGDHRKIAKISEANAEPSRASKNHEIYRPSKQIDLGGDGDQVSDNTSFLEISTPCVLPDLNLDPADISSPLVSSTSPVCNVANWQQLEV